ncbi:hypothetical protein [Pedobacter sp.]|uniref:hypothetical protein n=1 Tax=Pedobacter sp. TaxID=1411316 RepID=UPI002C5BC523|nr:hypothetical protein [Pedobacter sp.]HWW42229.1 hypothetical protein [Pedobacter sp.]
MKQLLIFPILTFSIFCYAQNDTSKMKNIDSNLSNRPTNNKKVEFTCKLTSAEMRKRIETVVASLKKQVIEKKELQNGYAYKFKGNNKVVDELTEFIKTERVCCDFFDFSLSVNGDTSFAWLSITGPEGVKKFISSELSF